jgi:L-iditol 2-dehydrogenase
MMALQIAKLRGASIIVALGTNMDARRLEIAKQLGATHTLNIQRDDALALIQSLGDGFGADIVVDCTGISAAFKQSMALVRPNGTITKIGWGPQSLDASLDPIVAKAVTVQGSFSHTFATWERVLRLIANGQIQLKTIIGGVYALTEWHEAFERMEDGTNVKSVIRL